MSSITNSVVVETQCDDPAKGPGVSVKQLSMEDEREMANKESKGSATSATPPAYQPPQVNDPTCNIRYTYVCVNPDGPTFTETRDNVPLSLQISEKEGKERPPRILEIITEVDVTRPKIEKTSEASSEEKEERPSLENMHISGIGKPKMVIHSPMLLEAVREVIEYYPTQNLVGDTVTIREPYRVLMHHFPELQVLKAGLEENLSSVETDSTISEKCQHVQALLDFLHPEFQRIIVPAQKRLQKEAPTVTFDDVWYLLQPGLLSYIVLDGVGLGCVVKSVTFKQKNDSDPNRWEVCVWFQDNDWRTGSIGCAFKTINVEEFEGEKIVTSLPVFPRDYFDRKDNHERRRAFEKRGSLVCDILWKSYAYVNYDGKLKEEDSQEYKGPIMVGSVDLPNIKFPESDWTFDWDYDVKEGEDGLKDPQRPEWSKIVNPLAMHPTNEKHARGLLSDQHLFLMCPILPAFALATKTWTFINVDSISEMGQPEKLPDANIGAENLKVIRALSDRQTKSKVPWSADFIKNKGEGVVILLHGPPGVGKTYTVETTAISTGRPLIALTIADLGTKEEMIEAELNRWFTLAHRWRAILLIDEADIFLERRQHTDISRNGVVSAFLRKMEYFGGLLFLTTNRVGHIDEAFISRVHVVIGFEKLDPERRKAIWRSFLDKLARDREGQIRVAPSAIGFLLGKEMCELDWNGREIRNGFQTAIALAEYDACLSPYHKEGEEIIVESDHFRRVMAMSRSFRAYIDSIRADTEGQRAQTLYGRNDYFKVQSLPAGHA